ncbi:copper transporter 1-like [Punica granatum]|uniref:Copper transport protein n=2 Tax=Punica granatum TaxID=22663 RepID=A0A218W9M4_PUNGR|nr:copper transporter 1-like [Punica granatum]OWM68772.1 hypothetical protein CDL15_Pgr024959 [Punica granatum]PKI66492.1 hypothetical protein CRG98_013148 [Punica granatum]
MAFSWAKTNTEIFFPNWPGHSLLSYVLALLLVFLLSVFVEWLSHVRLIKSNTDSVMAGILQTSMYALRVAVAYLVMLAIMSFDGGVFLSAVGGYTFGFLVFGSQMFRKWRVGDYQEPSDLPPLNC